MPDTPTPTEAEALCERLEATRFAGMQPGGPDNNGIPFMLPVNIDGPAAATLIRQQQAEIERLRGALSGAVEWLTEQGVLICACGQPECRGGKIRAALSQEPGRG